MPDDTPDSSSNTPSPIEPLPDNLGVTSTFETLLKRPGDLLHALLEGDRSGQILRNLAVTTLACLAVFGFVIGTHSAGAQLWAAPLKISLGMLFAGLICLPSLYIFSCLSGLDVKFKSVSGVLFAALCMIALLLLGFTPVVWIFSQSTNSLVFMGVLALLFWTIAAWFGLGLISKTAETLGVKNRSHITVWMGIFILVALQMSTSLRPIIGTSDELLTNEKKFFLTHWSEQFQNEARTTLSRQARTN